MSNDKVIMVEVLLGMKGGVVSMTTVLPVPLSESEHGLLWACVRVGLLEAIAKAFPDGGEVENVTADLALVPVSSLNTKRLERVLSIDLLTAERWSIEVEKGVHLAGLFNRYTLGREANGEVL